MNTKKSNKPQSARVGPFGKMIIISCAVLVIVLEVITLYAPNVWDKINIKFSTFTQPRYIIARENDGFYPRVMTIKIGEVVEFVSHIDQPMWPASDLHPTHDVYPDFDPKKPLFAGESFSFKFEKAGRWSFHDHLDSTKTGMIIVLPPGETDVSNSCDVNGKKELCWQETIKSVLEKDGVSAAFELVSELYDQDKNFAKECHSYSHLIGQEAYVKYAEEKEITLDERTSDCGYGFYHGFMETLLLSTGDAKGAQQFCEEVSAKSGLPNAWTACYHGIGHGAIDGSDESAWGNIKLLQKPGLTLCEDATSTSLQHYLCVTGVYNALDVLSNDPKHNITWLREDPFSFCNLEPSDYQEPCYTNMVPVVMELFDNDFSDSVSYIIKSMKYPNGKTIDDYTNKEMVVSGLFHEYVRLHLFDDPGFEKGIDLCHTLDPITSVSCIEGISGGHMKYGKPSDIVDSWSTFCSNKKLTTEEREVCFKHVLTRLSIWYPINERSKVCNRVPVTYRKYCQQLS
jgi:hypothetical protein